MNKTDEHTKQRKSREREKKALSLQCAILNLI